MTSAAASGQRVATRGECTISSSDGVWNDQQSQTADSGDLHYRAVREFTVNVRRQIPAAEPSVHLSPQRADDADLIRPRSWKASVYACRRHRASIAAANRQLEAGPVAAIATSGTLTIPPGEPSKAITVLVNGGRVGAQNERSVVDLGSPTNATIDDQPQVSISDVTKSLSQNSLPIGDPKATVV